MKVMISFPRPLASDSRGKTQQFLLVVLAEQYATAALWTVADGQAQLEQKAEDHAWQDEHTCINAIDQSLQELGKLSEKVTQTLFVLPSDWVDVQGIVAGRKPLFQRMIKELSLEPVGFVVSTEAMTQYLTQTAPQLNVLLIEVGVASLTVALVKAGQIAQTIKVGRSGDSVSDLQEALAHCKEAHFPAKMEIYSPALLLEELNEVQQQLLGFDWQTKYEFLHRPVIEVFEALAFVEVVLKTGGVALAASKGLIAKPVVAAAAPAVEAKAGKPAGDDTGDKPGSHGDAPEPVSELTDSDSPVKAAAAELGFGPAALTHEFAKTVDKTETREKVEKPEATGKTKKTEELAMTPEIVAASAAKAPPIKEIKEVKEVKETPAKPPRKHSPILAILRAHILFILVGIIAGCVILGIIAFIASRQLMKATVALQLKDVPLTQNLTLTLDPQSPASNPDQNILKANVVQQSETGSLDAPTTGTKIIGDKAKGTVTVYNYTSSQKTFAAGTKLTANSLTYTLDSSATVASASSSLDSSNNMLTKPGSQDVGATATAIGEQSNIAAATSMMVESFAKETYSAVTKTAFAGGSSREIQAVSAQDQAQLLAALKKQLVEKAAQDAKTNAPSGQYEIPTNRVKVTNSTFSADVGKETNSLSLQLSLDAEMVQYSIADLRPLATQVLQKQLPSGYQLTEAAPEVMSQPVSSSTSSAQVTLQAQVSTQAEPQLNLDDLKRQIAGQSVKGATGVLQANTGVQSAQITLTPTLLGKLFGHLPTQVDRITITK